MWIYPKLIGPDTSCHLLTPFVVWKTNTNSDRTELGLSQLLSEPFGRINTPDLSSPEERRQALKGRLAKPLAKATLSDRTRGAFHLSDLFTGQLLRFRRR